MKGDNTQSYKKQYVLKKYTTDGTYLEDIYTFPKSPQAIIRHRGIIYYTYQDINTIREGNTNGTYKLMSFSLENKEEHELFVDDLVDGTLDKLIAYGKYIYIYRNGRSPDSDPNNQESYREETLAYDLETGTIQSVQATEKGVPSFPIPYENSLYTLIGFIITKMNAIERYTKLGWMDKIQRNYFKQKLFLTGSLGMEPTYMRIIAL